MPTITVTLPAGVLEQVLCYLADRGEVAAMLSHRLRSAEIAPAAPPADGE